MGEAGEVIAFEPKNTTKIIRRFNPSARQPSHLPAPAS